MSGAQAGSAEGSAERQRQSRPQLGHQCVGGPHLGAPLPCVAGEIPRGAPLPYGVIFHAAPFCIAAPMEESQWGVRNIGRNNTQQNTAQTFWGPHVHTTVLMREPSNYNREWITDFCFMSCPSH